MSEHSLYRASRKECEASRKLREAQENYKAAVEAYKEEIRKALSSVIPEIREAAERVGRFWGVLK